MLAFDGQPATELAVVGRQLNRRPRGERLRLEVLSVRRRGMLLQMSRATATLTLRLEAVAATPPSPPGF